MDQLQLPIGVDELEDWLARSGGRTGRITGVRRARWEDWRVIHSLATEPSTPLSSGLTDVRRVSDGLFELRNGENGDLEATLCCAMMFFDVMHDVEHVVEGVFAAADYSLQRRAALGKPRWLAIDLALDEADLDADEVRALLENDVRVAELEMFEYCALLLDDGPPTVIDSGMLRPRMLAS